MPFSRETGKWTLQIYHPEKFYIYFRYIDDVLLIHPRRTKIPELVRKLNSVEKSIQFTHELEQNSTLPFLDVLIHREDTSLLFSVYRKPTYKNDNIHFLSHHSQRIKSGIVIGAFLRAYRICSPHFIDSEIEHIRTSFKELKYPDHIIQNCHRKAKKTFFKSKPQNLAETTPSRISLPTNRLTASLSTSLNSKTHQIVTTTSKTVREILDQNAKTHRRSRPIPNPLQNVPSRLPG